ncbi:hypothetical protein ONE63_005073 [Megalurothrips usitatus]|uniref:C2H2-type domain-containing protein n=1 Tax=Megalurothrips usitatus TaxID=439358 RepID=A0AAV7X2H9_9NEOP|nr:hypothetical protein ONE63_005073 [Megalurothrips usitatus]
MVRKPAPLGNRAGKGLKSYFKEVREESSFECNELFDSDGPATGEEEVDPEVAEPQHQSSGDEWMPSGGDDSDTQGERNEATEQQALVRYPSFHLPDDEDLNLSDGSDEKGSVGSVASEAAGEDSPCEDTAPNASGGHEPQQQISKQGLNITRLGGRSLFRCLHPACRSSYVYGQKMMRHYFLVHAKVEGPDGVREDKMLAERLYKQYQNKDSKVAHTFSLKSVQACFAADLPNDSAFLDSLSNFLAYNRCAFVDDTKERVKPSLPVVDEEAVDDPGEEGQVDLSPKALGLTEHCAVDHKLLEYFVEAKRATAAGASNPETAVYNARGYCSRVIAFIEKRITTKKDEWDVLRYPEVHRKLVQNLSMSTYMPNSRENFKKIDDTLVLWCSAGNGLRGAGRLRLKPSFPKDEEGLDNKIAEIGIIWSDYKKTTLLHTVSEAREEAEVNVNVESFAPYFASDEIREDIVKDISALKKMTKEPVKWIKEMARYDADVSSRYNRVVRYLAVCVVRQTDRGGVPLTMTLDEVLAAKCISKAEQLYRVRVANHKNRKRGPLDVVLEKKVMELFLKFASVRKRMLSMATGTFKSRLFLVGLNDGPVQHIYVDIRKWAAAKNEPAFSSRSFRRSVQTLAHNRHDAETFIQVAAKQNHKPGTALTHYVSRSDQRTVVAFRASENVIANAVMAKEAMANVAKWFPLSPTTALPSLDDVQKTLVENCTHEYPQLVLSQSWYSDILYEIKKTLRRATILWLSGNVKSGKLSEEEANEFLNSDSFVLKGEKNLKIMLQKALGSP